MTNEIVCLTPSDCDEKALFFCIAVGEVPVFIGSAFRGNDFNNVLEILIPVEALYFW